MGNILLIKFWLVAALMNPKKIYCYKFVKIIIWMFKQENRKGSNFSKSAVTNYGKILIKYDIVAYKKECATVLETNFQQIIL